MVMVLVMFRSICFLLLQKPDLCLLLFSRPLLFLSYVNCKQFGLSTFVVFFLPPCHCSHFAENGGRQHARGEGEDQTGA